MIKVVMGLFKRPWVHWNGVWKGGEEIDRASNGEEGCDGAWWGVIGCFKTLQQTLWLPWYTSHMLAHSSTHRQTSSDTITLWNTWYTSGNLQHSSKALRLYHTSAHSCTCLHSPCTLLHTPAYLCTGLHTPAHVYIHVCIHLHTLLHTSTHFCTLPHTSAHLHTLMHTAAHPSTCLHTLLLTCAHSCTLLAHTEILPHTQTHSNTLHSVKVWRRWANFTHPFPISLFPHNLNLLTPSHQLPPQLDVAHEGKGEAMVGHLHSSIIPIPISYPPHCSCPCLILLSLYPPSVPTLHPPSPPPHTHPPSPPPLLTLLPHPLIATHLPHPLVATPLHSLPLPHPVLPTPIPSWSLIPHQALLLPYIVYLPYLLKKLAWASWAELKPAHLGMAWLGLSHFGQAMLSWAEMSWAEPWHHYRVVIVREGGPD